MSETYNESRKWKQELASLVDYTGTMKFNDEDDDYGRNSNSNGTESPAATVRTVVKEFGKGVGEISVEFIKSLGEIIKQTLGDEDSFIVSKVGKPCSRICARLGFLNQYFPEDRDPLHCWIVIFFVFLVAVAALNVNTTSNYTPAPVVRKMSAHPPNANRIMLTDGRHLAYHEQGVQADIARFCIILPHSFLSSRLAGIPGLKSSLLEDFGVRLITYDLPGFGESDPHPHRTLESSALDMSHLADALQVHDKFWVVGFSSSSMHIWAALRYIPDRIAGAAMFSPMVNPYDPSMTKEEKSRVWEKWTTKKKLMFILAQRFPGFLRYLYHRSFFSGKHGPIDEWLSLSLGKRDRALIGDTSFEEFWQRNVEESIRQGDVNPFVEESMLEATNWGFSVAELQTRKRNKGVGILLWLKSMYSPVEEELTGFLGPIHIWQGMDDRMVPASMAGFFHRVLPGATVHMLPNDGHFTYFNFCDECHRKIFATLFGTPQGPLQNNSALDSTLVKDDDTQP